MSLKAETTIKMINNEVVKKKTNFFRKVQKEFKKISWTNKKDLIKLSKVVLTSIILGGLGIYIADISIRNILEALSSVSYWIFG